MENFEKIPRGDELISQIFNSQEDFRKSVREALEWSKNGGPEIGSSSFIKAVVGNIKMENDDYASIKKAILKEVAKIDKKNDGEGERKKKLKVRDLDGGAKTFSKKEMKMMVDDSRKQILKEARRSGDDPDLNELYPNN
ncbi:MAG: hypothetical protein ACLFNN_01795 [Candidatus Paceibacterota bacterium]